MLLLTNIRQIVQITDDNREFLAGNEMKNIKLLSSDTCSLKILCERGIVSEIFFSDEETSAKHLLSCVDEKEQEKWEVVDCKGGSVIPGLVDAHSHPVFAGDRVHEFEIKLAGATYMDIQAMGGGIHFTTEKTRATTANKLLDDFIVVSNEMLASGTTLLEAKSGYGLELETELKMLEVLEKAMEKTPLEISATFCGAHAVPKGATEATQTQAIVDDWLPVISTLKKEGHLKNTENIDVFCERGVFELENSRRILECGQKMVGLRTNFHADELSYLGGAELAGQIRANAVSHLEEISDAGIEAIAKSKTVAVLLPTTAYVLRLKSPPVRKMLEAGVCVALGSDFNPNAYCLAMPMVMNMACVLFGMSMPEALVAATLNAAHSLGRGRTHGAISKGRVADFVVLDAPWQHIIYRMIISHVIKSGKTVYKRK